jgi:Uma2 family endonuclease
MMSSGHKIGEILDLNLTYEDYCALPEDGRRYQLIGGELDVTPAPSYSHQRILRNLGSLLHAHVRGQHLGVILYAPIDVILATDTVVQPDIVFVAREHLSRVNERGIEGPPDLVVEILSPRTRRTDRVLKMRAYAHFGVRQCWLVDPDTQSIEVFSLSSSGYVLARVATCGETVRSDLFPELSLALDEIFAPDE